MLAKPCLSCGDLTRNGSRCPACESNAVRLAGRLLEKERRARDGDRGYNGAWKKLSRRARELQPFCEVCGATDDLQADHTPRAWQRRLDGLAVRLVDIRVLCGSCNRAAGDARPGSQRWKEFQRSLDDLDALGG